MPIITIQGTIIDAPNVAADPNWAPAIIQFMQAVELALRVTTGDFDVAPQTLNIDSYNPGTNVNIDELSFSVADVRDVTISYAVVRSTSLSNVSESGTFRAVYNSANPIGNKFEVTRVARGDASISLAISDTGQVSFSTSALSGTGHAGTLIFSAKALQNAY